MNKLINNLNIISKQKNIYKVYNLLKEYNIHDWEQYSIKNPKNYEKKIIFKNDDYELILINWEKGAFTNYHNHPLNGCVLKLLNGSLYEKFDNSRNVLYKNYTSVRLHNDVHKIIANEKSYSLHYYSPPNFYGLK